ncbi:MAG: hypothetical protein KC545_14365, partial [Nitrospira sp.]|nr:hypothetical protein [Nitrospira sp.]
MEQQIVAPMRISLKHGGITKDGPPAGGITQKEMIQAAGNISGHFPQAMWVTGTRRTVDGKVI